MERASCRAVQEGVAQAGRAGLGQPAYAPARCTVISMNGFKRKLPLPSPYLLSTETTAQGFTVFALENLPFKKTRDPFFFSVPIQLHSDKVAHTELPAPLRTAPLRSANAVDTRRGRRHISSGSGCWAPPRPGGTAVPHPTDSAGAHGPVGGSVGSPGSVDPRGLRFGDPSSATDALLTLITSLLQSVKISSNWTGKKVRSPGFGSPHSVKTQGHQ